MTLSSFDGSSQPSTFRCTTIINGYLLSTLIDSGSSHSFIHPNKLKHLSLPQPDKYTFQVRVGSGHTLQTGGTLKSVQFSIQEVDFEECLRGRPGHGHLNEQLHVLIEAESPANLVDAKLEQAKEIIEELIVPVVCFLHTSDHEMPTLSTLLVLFLVESQNGWVG
ncbi:KH domain-containing protein [Artemisia annua]|uniref:KH domain-containing protein n=1 Tax=Artemisia annua TaxID=35608 RepID=A0A2U1NZV7_ARTAN|nr:KH domain-containing protein [Artemisia annua]